LVLALIAAGLIAVGLVWPATQPAVAAAGINQTLNFQGRLLTASGAVVPDGTYNVEFKIYQDGAGTTAGDTGGTLKWTEDRVYGTGSPDNRVTVRNGYFSVALGSVTAFGTSVDWNQDTLWLSINVGNTSSAASFAAASGDGEMLPMRRLSSSVYALNAGRLGGLTSAQYLQLAQGVQTDSSTTQPSIGVNKTAGTQNLITLQSSGTDVFDVTSTGNLQFGSNANKTISVATVASGNGKSLTLQAGAGNGTDKNGGDLILQGGNPTGAGTAGKVVAHSGVLIDAGDIPEAFKVLNSGGDPLILADTTTQSLRLGAVAITYSGLQPQLDIINNAFVSTLYVGSTYATDIELGRSGQVLNVLSNTTVASGQSLTVAGGATSLTGGPTGSGTAANVATGAASNKGLVVQGASGQTADLLQLQDGTGANVRRVDASGNEETTGYINNGIGGIGQFANLLTYSEQFDNAAWSKTGVVVTANSTVAPDGLTTADTLAGTGASNVQQTYTTATNGTYTYSVWLKTSSGTATVGLRIDSTGATPATGTVSTVTARTTWQRFSVTQTFTGTPSNIKPVILPGNGSTATVIGWGAQLVLASNPQVYTRSTASAVAASQGVVSNGGLFVSSINSTDKPLIIQGAPSQASDLMQAQDSTGAVLARITAAGSLNIASGQTYQINGADINTAGTLANVAYLSAGQTFTGANVFQPTTNITGLTVKQNSNGSPTADIFNVQTANGTSVLQVTGPAANEAAVTLQARGATRDLTLASAHDVVLNPTGSLLIPANIKRSSSGTTTIDLNDATNTTLSLVNNGAGIASFTADGGISGLSLDAVLGVTAGIQVVSPSYTSSGATAITVDPGGAALLNLGTGNATGINIGNNNAAHTINIGNTGATGTQAITIGGTANTANTVLVQGGTGGSAVSLQAAAAGTIVIGTTNANTVSLGNTGGSISLNSDTTLAAGKNLSIAAGTGTVTQTFSTTGAGTASTLNLTNGSGTQTNGFLVNRNAASGTTTNGINITNAAGTLTNGLAFTGTIGTDITRASGTLTVQGASGISLLSNTSVAQGSTLKVGTNGTATGQLYIAGLVPSGTAGSITTNVNFPWSMAVQGKYAYLANQSGNTISSYDVSDPASPVAIGTVSTGASTGPTKIIVSGHYAYVTLNTSSQVAVYDISDPANMVQKDLTGVGANPAGMYLQGRYLYVACNGNNSIDIVDVASPTALYDVGGFSTGASSNPTAVFAEGNMLYVTLNGTAKLALYNISNDFVTRISSGAAVLTPTSYTAVTTTSGAYGLFVAGRYAYVTNYSGNTMQIIDLKSPSAAAVVGTYSTGASSNPTGIYVQGRYAYITTFTSNTLQIVDVSNPASPTLVTSGSISTGASSNPLNGLVVQGRYAYVATTGTGDALQIYDVGGVYAQQLEAGGAEVGTLRVDGDTSLGGELSIQGGATIGHGLEVTGDVSASGQVRLQGKNDSDNALQVLDTSGFEVLTVSTSLGRVGIGTATPSAPLTIVSGNTTTGVSLYSGVSGGKTAFTLGQTGVDGTLAVAGAAGNFATGAAQGDIILRAESSSNRVILGAGGTATLAVSNTDVDVAGDIQLNATGTATLFGLCHSGADSDTTFTNRDIVACSGSQSGVNDYAEFYPTEDDVAYGDLVALSDDIVEVYAFNPDGTANKDKKVKTAKLKKATPADRGKIVGIVSNNYTDFSSIGRAVLTDDQHPMPIALNGRVPLAVSAENGVIHTGDRLTASSVPGVAMKATAAGTTVGYAMAGYNGQGVGEVVAFVDVSFTDPDLTLSSTEDISLFVNGAQPVSGNAQYGVKDANGQEVNRVGVFSEGVIGNLQAGRINAASLNLSGSLEVGGDINATGNVSLTDLTVTGTANITDLHVTGSTVVADITIAGHIITAGTTPTVTPSSAACTDPEVTVTGNDTSGTLIIKAGSGCAAGGVLANVTFAKPYGAAPRVLLTPVGDDATDLKYNIGAVTTTGFEVKTKNAPTSGVTYTYYYHVEQ
jgi:hypothetical protein